MTDLHWTLDYSYQTTRGDFRGEFSQILAGALSSASIYRDANRKIHRYTLLPNFWSGHKPDAPDAPILNTGGVSLERTRNDRGLWQYRVEHVNTTSGEELSLEFDCLDEPVRPLCSPWRILTRNSADGSYSSVFWTGACSDANEARTITLTTQRSLSVCAGTASPEGTLTCNWALFDILPALDGGRLDGLEILEDLEMLRNHCRVRHLEEWTFREGGNRHELAGYCVFGEAFPPSYWWLTETGDVAAVATILSTYVLNERTT